jgi:hypothetical protein
MGLKKEAVETLMAQRSRSDLEFMQNKGNSVDQAGPAI